MGDVLSVQPHSLAANLRRLRRDHGQSLQDVADAIGASKTYIWELEKGRHDNPTIKLAAKLAKHFGVGITKLIGEKE